MPRLLFNTTNRAPQRAALGDRTPMRCTPFQNHIRLHCNPNHSTYSTKSINNHLVTPQIRISLNILHTAHSSPFCNHNRPIIRAALKRFHNLGFLLFWTEYIYIYIYCEDIVILRIIIYHIFSKYNRRKLSVGYVVVIVTDRILETSGNLMYTL